MFLKSDGAPEGTMSHTMILRPRETPAASETKCDDRLATALTATTTLNPGWPFV